MLRNISKDLIERFNKFHGKDKILECKVRENDNFKIETIYYENFNVLGALKKTTLLNNGITYIDDNSLLVGDITVFLEKSRWFK